MHQHATLEDTVYFWFASNDTSGSGDDGASAAAHVRLAGATISDAPILSPSPGLISHVTYPAGAYEVAVAATAANGFAAGNTYGVFATLAVDSQNPTGFIGSFSLDPIIANIVEVSDDATAATNAEAFFDGTGYAGTNNVIPTVTTVSGLATNAITAAAIATDAIGAAELSQAAVDQVWSTAARTLTASTNFNDVSVADILTTQMTEAYAADGAAPTLTQALMMIQQMLGDFTISGTTLTVRKVDGAATAGTYTLSDATNPVGLTRAS
jgi:hypothetical protein